MSNLSRFMSTARTILDEKDGTASKSQPPFFVRTTWLFVELETLALSSEADIFEAIKVARLRGDIGAIPLKVAQIRSSSEGLKGQQHYERRKLCDWIIEQIEREPKR